jgi:hypothetical protein
MTISRKVLFYSVEDDHNILEGLFLQIQSLPPENMYTQEDQNKLLFLNVELSGRNVKGKLSFFKSGDFPTVIKKNSTTNYPLLLLPDEGLCNTTHFIYYPERKLIAVEYNHSGPRISALKRHLAEKAPPEYGIDFLPVMKSNMIESLRKLKNIKLVDIKVSVTMLDQTKYFDESIYDALDNARKFGGTETVELKLSSGRKNSSILNLSPQLLKEKLNAMIGRGLNPAATFDKLEVSGLKDDLTGNESIDIVKQWTFGQATVARLGLGREVNSESMFEEINRIYSAVYPNNT